MRTWESSASGLFLVDGLQDIQCGIHCDIICLLGARRNSIVSIFFLRNSRHTGVRTHFLAAGLV